MFLFAARIVIVFAITRAFFDHQIALIVTGVWSVYSFGYICGALQERRWVAEEKAEPLLSRALQAEAVRDIACEENRNLIEENKKLRATVHSMEELRRATTRGIQ